MKLTIQLLMSVECVMSMTIFSIQQERQDYITNNTTHTISFIVTHKISGCSQVHIIHSYIHGLNHIHVHCYVHVYILPVIVTPNVLVFSYNNMYQAGLISPGGCYRTSLYYTELMVQRISVA